MSSNTQLKDMLYAALFSALIAVLALISIPVGLPAPITGQTLGIMLAGSILTKKQTIFSILTYLSLGIAGMPVFALGSGGLSILVGPRGGFLIGFLIGALVINLMNGNSNSIARTGISCFIGGVIVVYLIGVTWMCYQTTGKILSIPLMLGSMRYLPFDLLKVGIATFVAVRVKSRLKLLTSV